MKNADFVKSTTWTLVTRLLIMGLTFLIGVVMARVLGPTDLGAFSVALVVPSLVSLFLQFGLGVANVYFIGRKKYPADVLLGNALTLSLITSVLVLPLYLLLIPFLLRTVAVGVQVEVLVLIGLSIPLALIGGHLSYIFLGLQDIQEYNLLKLVRNGSTLLFLVVFVLILRLGVTGAVVAMVLAWTLMVVRGLWAMRRVVAVRLLWNWLVLKDCLRLGIKGYLANLFQFFNYRLDVLLLSFFMGVTAVGIYAVAVAATEVLWYVPEAVATVLFPRTAGTSEEEARSFTPMVSRAVFPWTLALGVLLALLSYPVVILVFGGQYAAAVLPLRLLLPGVVMLSLSKVLSSDLGGRGLLLYNTLSSLVGLIATVALDTLLIPRWGINGAAVASSISYTLSTLLVLVLYIRVSGNIMWDILVPQRSDWRIYRTGWTHLSGLISRGDEH
jgi:O-antigen/teichoic acid export membrane protein